MDTPVSPTAITEPPSRSLSRRLIGGATVVCLLILAIAGFSLHATFEQEIRKEQSEIRRSAFLLAEHTAQLVEALDAVLIESLDDLDDTLIASPERLHQFLKEHAAQSKAINEMVFVAADGMSIANSTRHPPAGVSLVQRSYYRHHQDRVIGGLFISEPLRRPVTAVWNITLSRRLSGPDGSFRGVLLIAISPQYFTALWEALGFGHDYSANLFRADATLLARYPASEEMIGKVYGRNPQSKAFFEGDMPSLSARLTRSNIDAQPNLIEFRRVPRYPLAITISVPQAVVHAAWLELAVGVAGMALLSITVVIGVFTLLAREIAQREQAQARIEAEIVRSNADLEQFAYAVSHDLKAPLRTVTGFLGMIERKHGAALPDGAHEYLNWAESGALRMNQMIEALLEYSRIHRLGNPPVAVDLESRLVEATTNLATVIADSGARIAHDPLPTVMGDPNQLTRLLQNLIGNAIKYRRPDLAPNVRVTAQRQGRFWEIAIADNGIGIDPTHREKLFKVFSRLHGEGVYEGTGIGLALCRSIVERTGGRIGVDSAGEGHGSTFRFTLPVA